MKTITSVLLCLLVVVGPANAADSLWLTGSEWLRLGSYSYVGVLTPLGQGSFGNGWVMRQWVDRLTYDYDGAQPGIHAESYGYSPALGYQRALGRGWAGLYAGVRLAHTDVSPYDPSNADRGTHGRLSIQAEAFTALGGSAENQLIAQAEIGNGGYYVRDRVLVRVLGLHTIGAELVAKGNREYSAGQAGLVFGGMSVGKRTNLLLRGGINCQRGQSSGGYAGFELALGL